MLGRFSNGGLGMGVAMYLDDHFSGAAAKVEKSMAGLEGKTAAMTANMDRSMNRMRAGFGAAVAGGVMVAPFVMSIDAASDLAESMGKVNVVFGKYQNLVRSFVESQAESYGLSKQAAYEAIGTYGNLFTALGMGQKEASGYSVSLTKLAADLASFNNTSIDDAIVALRAGMTGEFESLKKYGIAVKQEMIVNKALEMGLIKRGKHMEKMITPLIKMQAMYGIIMDQTKNAQGDFLRTGEGYANGTRKLKATFENLKASMGNIAMEAALPLMSALKGILELLRRFADSPAGRVIMKLVFALGLILIVGGSVIGVMSGLKMVVGKLAGAFNASTRASILNALATKGLRAGLYQLGKAAWASIGPYAILVGLIMIFVKVAKWAWKAITEGNSKMMLLGSVILMMLGPIGWIIWLFAMMKRAVNEFNKLGDGQKAGTGLIGWLQRVGGYIVAAKEIWRSWNGETFTISEKLKKKLEALGIWDSVLKMATWLVRFKTVMMGVWEGMKEGFKAVWGVMKSIFNSIYEAMRPATKELDKMNLGFKKNTSDLEKWKKIGKYIGYAIVGIIVLITISMVIMALAMLAAMIVPLIIIGLIVVIVWALYKAWQYLKQAALDCWQSIGDALRIVWHNLQNMWDYIASLPGRAWQWGKDLVSNIWKGIKSAWQNLMENLAILWETMKVSIGLGDEKKLRRMIGEHMGKEMALQIKSTASHAKDGMNTVKGMTSEVPLITKSMQNNRIVRRAADELSKRPTQQKQTIQNNIHLDGKLIATEVREHISFDHSRD